MIYIVFFSSINTFVICTFKYHFFAGIFYLAFFRLLGRRVYIIRIHTDIPKILKCVCRQYDVDF